MNKIEEGLLENGWVSASRVSEIFAIHISTVHRKVDRGDLDGKRVGSRRFVSVRSVLNHFEDGLKFIDIADVKFLRDNAVRG